MLSSIQPELVAAITGGLLVLSGAAAFGLFTIGPRFLNRWLSNRDITGSNWIGR